MKTIRLGIIPMLVCLLFTACKDDDIVKRVEEGRPFALKFTMTIPGNTDVNPLSRASDEVESNVKTLALFFYKYEGSTPYVIELDDSNLALTGTGEGVNAGTNYFYSITIPEEQMTASGVYSGSYWIYAVANWDYGFCRVDLDELKSMTRSQLEEHCVLKTNNLLDLNETALLLTGKYKNGEQVDLQPDATGAVTLDGFHLKRLTAKIIFNFINGTNVTFTPTSYDIYNYSRSSTLLERSGWVDASGNVAEDTGTNPGTTLDYCGSADEGAFADSSAPIQITGRGFEFYMLENVQKISSDLQSVTDWRLREKRGSGANHDTFDNAPAKGTYVVVHGTYSGPRGTDDEGKNIQVTGNVIYTIHLGDFSNGNYNNYTVRRNGKYTYNVTVNGVDNIYVEATSNVENQPGAEGNILASQNNVYHLDAHFETAMLQIPKTNQLTSYTLLVHTPDGVFHDGVDKEGTPIGSTVAAEHLKWIQFGKPASTTAFAGKYPGWSTFKSGAEALDDASTQLIDVYGLMDLLKGNHSNRVTDFLLEDGDYYYVTAYVDEYYYGGESANDPETKPLSDFINARDREMSLSSTTSVSSDGYSSYTVEPIFSITQRSIKSVYNLDGSVLRPFGVETVEETAAALLTSAGAGKEPTTNNPPSLAWGWRNQWEQLPGYEDKPSSFLWNNYVNVATNGHFSSDDGKPKSKGIMQSGYEYALYQCFSRNRDENGNGYIDVEEMKWYLPAIQECTSLFYGNDVLPAEARFTDHAPYFSSTNGRYRTWWNKEGLAFGRYKDEDGERENYVRCIRTLGVYGVDYAIPQSNPNDNTYKEESASVATADIVTNGSQNCTIVMHNMAASTTRQSGTQSGEYTPHTERESQNQLPEAFQIATRNLDGTFTADQVRYNNLCASYSETGAPAGTWRIPNAKELGLMFRFYKREGAGLNDDTFLSDYTAARTAHVRDDDGTNIYYINRDGSQDFQFITTSMERTTNFVIRCVRDVQP